MATIKFKGLEDYELQLSRLEKMTPEIAGRAIYQGAKIVADEIRKNIEKKTAYDDKAGIYAYVLKNNPPLTRTAKKGLLDGCGISEIRNDDGFYNVKLGFSGYNGLKTKKYPKGQPNVLIARVLESGSSISEKSPFIRPAITSKKKAAEQAMAKELEKEIQKIMK